MGYLVCDHCDFLIYEIPTDNAPMELGLCGNSNLLRLARHQPREPNSMRKIRGIVGYLWKNIVIIS